jgi:hypothetical protein
VLHAVGTVTELIVLILIGGIQDMQNIHSRNRRQALYKVKGNALLAGP